MERPAKRQIVGWIAVGLSAATTGFWAFWGIVENFHEGWYFESWLSNVGLMLVQYLSPMLLFMGVTLVAIYWPRAGAGLHGMLALGVAWFFGGLTNPVTLFLMLPLVGLGALYWYGRPRPRKVATSLAIGLPLLVLIVSGVGPALRVSQRLDDGNFQARLVQGNGLALVWAPDGPGWPREGANWVEARRVCEHLSQDGLTLAPEAQQIWRLPAVDEAVRSLARHGQNSGGVWDAKSAKATYETTPDKESPLWDVHSQVIYWWTASEADSDRAYIIVYDGEVWPRPKDFGPAYLGFRCVKPPPAD
ncbi:MAG: DUF1566 domain-containing protein [Anaerolineae bacterium]|jgi:hypothetical protein